MTTVMYFGWLDYLVFGGMLLLSALIGIYFAFFSKKKQNTTEEYLMGGKTMGMFPISMSLIASYVSGITLLGLPAEMYVYGTQFWMIAASEWAVSLIVSFVYLPVFFNLQITSTYEYLALRFDSNVRLFGSIIFLTKLMLYIPVVIYVPALAFNQVTGINLHWVTPIVCIVCIFYTCLGGLKAVVWADTLQTSLMYFGIIFVLVYGTIRVGGVSKVIEINREGDRLEFFNMSLDPTIRHTFWTTVVGNFFTWLSSYSVNHAMMQRCLALSSLKRAIITVWILAVGVTVIVTLCCATGLVIYAAFATCDPLTTGAIKKNDQLLPYFVMILTGPIPALPGIFMSGVFSAALSTMSTGLNSMCAVIYEDFVKPMYGKPITEKTAGYIMKLIVLIIGFGCVGLVFLVEHIGALIQGIRSLDGITSGTLLGLFTMGLFLPFTNSKGALVGGISSISLMAWTSIGTMSAMSQGLIVHPVKPVSTSGCPTNLTDILNTIQTYDTETTNKGSPFFMLYRLSYLYYTLVGLIVTIAVGSIVSYFTKPNVSSMVHRDLLTPVIHRWLPAQDPRCPLPRFKKGDPNATPANKLEIRLD